MAEMLGPHFQHQMGCSQPFPPRNLSTQPYEMTTLDEDGIHRFESLVNVVDAQYNELGDCYNDNQMREEARLNSWSRGLNTVPDTTEQRAQTLIEAFDPLETPHWDIAVSQTTRLYPLPHPDTALQTSKHHQDCPSTPATSLVRNNGTIPWSSPQPVYDPLFLSSSLSNSETIVLDEHELKRLRNTAASARFRAKKRLREERLEQSAREKREKLAALEEKIRLLELENKCLRNLAIGKYNSTGDIEFVEGAIQEREEDPST